MTVLELLLSRHVYEYLDFKPPLLLHIYFNCASALHRIEILDLAGEQLRLMLSVMHPGCPLFAPALQDPLERTLAMLRHSELLVLDETSVRFDGPRLHSTFCQRVLYTVRLLLLHRCGHIASSIVRWQGSKHMRRHLARPGRAFFYCSLRKVQTMQDSTGSLVVLRGSKARLS